MVAKNVEELQVDILEKYPNLSRRLQQVAQHLLDHPDDMALETLAVVAKRIGVQPSTIVRFAQAMGFEGASSIQRLYRANLLSGKHSLGYRERIRDFKKKTSASGFSGPRHLVDDLVEGSILSLEHFRNSVSMASLTKTAKIIDRAPHVYLAGFGRSYSVSAYISYALQRLQKRTCLVSGGGGASRYEIRQAARGDALIAIGFEPYSTEIVEVLRVAREAKLKIIGISDSQVSPICVDSHVSFIVADAEIRGFRSLTTSMLLAQAIVLGYAYLNIKE